MMVTAQYFPRRDGTSRFSNFNMTSSDHDTPPPVSQAQGATRAYDTPKNETP